MRRTLSLIVALAACLPLAGRADPFGHEWCVYPAESFEILSDLKPRQIRRLATELEIFRQTAARFIPGAGAANLPIRIVVFRDRDDFRETMNSPTFGGFMQPSLRGATLVLGPQGENRLLHTTARHEYSHYLLRNRIEVSFPVWYDEGLASFLSTMSTRRRSVLVGEAPARHLNARLQRAAVSLEELIEAKNVYTWERGKLNDFYTGAWTVVHYLTLGHLVGFQDRREQLNRYLSEVVTPFQAVMDLPYDQLQTELLTYTDRRKLPTIALPRPEIAESSAEVSCLTEDERDYELALAMIKKRPENALSIFADLQRKHPDDVRHLVGLAAASAELNRPAEAEGYAAAAVKLAPDEPGAQIEYGIRLIRGCIMVRALDCDERWQKAVTLFRSGVRADPERFDAVMGLGLSYLHSGRPGDALNYLKIAYQKAPWAPHLNFYLGETYRLIGDPRARRHLLNARNWTDQDLWRRLATAALEQIDEATGEQIAW
ncbi:MAG: tetratricopeptide repeat protein [Pseudomonadales bacterium]|nr:tetratricopeptide repeat protein [Pseudomonadales bacterium]NIX06579.1 tetratricopeptide repeat protein [Pseudomonadales bacterium]